MTDYIVESRSDKFLQESAERYVRSAGVNTNRPIDVISLANAPAITTVYGSKRLILEVLDSDEMGADDGRTSFARDTVSIQIRDVVWAQANELSARARMTIAHELGHAVLHKKYTLSRESNEGVRPNFIEASRSAERQAKIFAARILMPNLLVLKCKTPSEISKTCLVSLQSAEIRFAELSDSERRKDFALKMHALAAELRGDPVATSPKFLSEPCPSCGFAKIQPTGCKYLCLNCDRVMDEFQDGDP